MSGKYEKNKVRKKNKLPMILIASGVVLVILLSVFLLVDKGAWAGDMQDAEHISAQLQQTEFATAPRQSLRNDMEVLDIGGYTGIYMEDGTDEIVTDVLMMKLINNGEDTVQYAKITLDIGEETAEFTVSTLLPGATVVLLEQNRMRYDKTVDYSGAYVICENLALFQEPLSIHEDKISVQMLDGAINVMNESGQDIPGRISIYYKNKAAGIYYGGITYRITLENGLKAGEIRQLMASHFSDTGSEIMFITIAE